MTILGEPKPAFVEPTADHGVEKIKVAYDKMCADIEKHLKHINKLTEKHGRSDIDTSFGADAAEFASLYAQAKALVDLHPNCSVGNLPT
jgi:hypothetical protein